MLRLGPILLVWSVLLLGSVTASHAENVRTRILVNPGAAVYVPIWVAQDQGLFAKHGVDAVIVSNPNPLTPMVSGDVDIDFTSPPVVLNAFQQGLKIRIFMTLVSPVSQQLMITSAFADAHPGIIGRFPDSILGLKGETIGVTVPGGAIDTNMRYIIRAAGLTPNQDINVVTTGGVGPLLASLLGGKLNAALLLSPASEQAVLSGKAKVLLDLSKGQGPPAMSQPFVVGVAVQAFLSQHPEAVQGIRDAMIEAMTYVKDPAHLEHITDIAIDKVYGGQIDRTVARASIETLAATMDHPWFDEADLRKVQDVIAQVGASLGSVPYDRIVDTSIVPRAPAK